MEAGWRARLKGADQKENSSPRGRAQTTGLAVAGREGTTRDRADEPGPRGEENKKEKETDTRRSQAITALAAPDLQRPVH